MTDAHSSRFLRLPEVLRRVGLSRSTVYRMISAGSFPDPVKVTARTSAWVEAAVSAWMAERMQTASD
jgi:prophage regulatory protein